MVYLPCHMSEKLEKMAQLMNTHTFLVKPRILPFFVVTNSTAQEAEKAASQVASGLFTSNRTMYVFEISTHCQSASTKPGE